MICRAIRAPLVEFCRRWGLCIDEPRCRAACGRADLRGRELWACMLDSWASQIGAGALDLRLEFIPEGVTQRLGAFAGDLLRTLFVASRVECAAEERAGDRRRVQCGCERAGAVSTFWLEIDCDVLLLVRGHADIVLAP